MIIDTKKIYISHKLLNIFINCYEIYLIIKFSLLYILLSNNISITKLKHFMKILYKDI